MQLTEQALAGIRKSTRAKNRLALANDCSVYTIDRWLKDNDDSLTKAASLAVIREETGLADSEILEETGKVNA